MPLITVKLIEGVFTPTQKREMIRELTEAMVSIEGENLRPVTWVVIEEVASGDWGIAGSPLTTEAVKSLAAGRRSQSAVREAEVSSRSELRRPFVRNPAIRTGAQMV
jgi:4-oxalocrotonate tautomerase